MDQVKTITLIDDDHICHMISTKIIQMFSPFSIECFSDAREALREFQQRASEEGAKFPEYILLDINMPGMDGWEFLDEFEKFSEPVLEKACVIMLTSSLNHRDIQKSQQYKTVRNFLSKPLTEEKLNMIMMTCRAASRN
jgi:CheY-like chemotaxis protein